MRTILVTGANRGIGLEFVRQYSSDGDHVIAVCRNDKDIDDLKAISEENNVLIDFADMSDFKSIDMLQSRLNGIAIDIIINNAGLFGPKASADGDLRQSFSHMDYNIWRKLMDVNTLAPYKIIECLIENIRTGNEKKLVSISSTVASLDSVASDAPSTIHAYKASKCALNMVMTSLARELKNEGINVGIYCPGWVNTRMGGDKAPITPETSVNGMRKLIDNLSSDQSGNFYRYNGEQIAW